MSRVLVVDDEDSVRRSATRILTQAGYDCEEATNGAEATELLESDRRFDAALCDIMMPGESGLDLARQLAADHPEVAVMMTTAVDDPATASLAFEIGAFEYLIKPFSANQLVIALSGALRRRDLERERIADRRQAGRAVSRARAVEGLVQAFDSGDRQTIDSEETIDRLSRAISLRDEETARHIQRMSRYAARLAEVVRYRGLAPDELRLAAALHDIGKIGVPDTVLLKPASLEPGERAMMQRHPVMGYQLLAGSTTPVMQAAARIALGHHEQWDGGGYPKGLAGDEIPEEARITAVADVFDAMTSDRVYRPAMDAREVADFMTSSLRDHHLEPRLVDAFVDVLDDMLEIRHQYPDERQADRISVFIVDDHEILVESLGRLFAARSDVRLIGSARSSAEAVATIPGYLPDVVLMDFDLPDSDGARTTEVVKCLAPETKVVMLTSWNDRETLVKAVRAGCSGFVAKEDTTEHLLTAIRAAYDGEIPATFAELGRAFGELRPTHRGLGADLRPRELQVLELIASGATNKVIASELYLSINTVRNHVQNIFLKLGAHSKLESVATAVQEGILIRTSTGVHVR